MRKDSTQSTYTEFIDSFIHPIVNILNSSIQPRINEEIKKVLRFSEHNITGDWYLYQNHYGISVYGSNIIPCKLPKYLPMRLFYLEYIRNILNSDSINFLEAKKKTQFKIKNQVGPFICNNRDAVPEAENYLQKFKFSKIFLCYYGPLGVISKLRVK